ncbi:MAG: PAS domain-containing protein [Paracoccaceae bacterium]|jgi:PAS domain-containing protein
MMLSEPVQIVFATLVGLLGAISVFGAMLYFGRRDRQTARALLQEAESTVVFLFDDEKLIDATPAARMLLRRRDGRLSDWEALIALLRPRFPHLRTQLANLAESNQDRIEPEDNGAGFIEAELWEGLARITLSEGFVSDAENTVDPVTLEAIEDELENLRSLGEAAPQLIWKQGADGIVTWANRAYLDVVEMISPTLGDETPPWPPSTLFHDIERIESDAPSLQRLAVKDALAQTDSWFDVTSLRRGHGTIHFGIDANASVKAEAAQRSFVQTLAKTFAQLSIGLAVFDRDRKLVMFNPSLLDLTLLPIEFLSSRPTLRAILDRMRENQRLPEPRDYATWREEISALETQASRGTYCENWALLGGETLRVTGRPHPDGAIAFLFEDISAEISLTRRFRSQIELGQHVIDTLDEAIAVFATSGQLTLSNRAYDDLWHSAQAHVGLSDKSISQEVAIWQGHCSPTRAWLQITDFVGAFGERTPTTVTVQLQDGRTLHCRIEPLPAGAALVGFSFAAHAGIAPKATDILPPLVAASI